MNCPHCGSFRLVTPTSNIGYEACIDCKSIWETLPEGETWLTDGELMPWRKPCDNCAFRAGSPESQDKAKWRELLGMLKRGGRFFCHKGVPLDWDPRSLEDPTFAGEHGFKYPTKPDGTEDPAQMRLCRGFLNAWLKWVEADLRETG